MDGEAMRTFWGWICAGVLVVAGVIFGLLNQITGLKQKVRQGESEKELGGTISKMEEAKENADEQQARSDSSYDDYRRARDEYERSTRKLPD